MHSNNFCEYFHSFYVSLEDGQGHPVKIHALHVPLYFKFDEEENQKKLDQIFMPHVFVCVTFSKVV